MAAPGFIDLPSTSHFRFEFNDQLNDSDARALGKALLDTSERDFNTISFWFGGIIPQGVPFDVKINLALGGASNDNFKNINLRQGASSGFNKVRSVLVAEVIEIFMADSKMHLKWDPGDSTGEGLSQLAAFSLYPDENQILNGPQVWLDTSVNSSLDKPSRPDFVNKTEPSDANFISFGCALLFLYYLRSQLGFNVKPIVQSGSETLEGVFRNLTKDEGAFQLFIAILENKFPSGNPSNLSGSSNPFPLSTNKAISARQFLGKKGPEILSQIMRSNNEMGGLRALLNTNRPVSLVH